MAQSPTVNRKLLGWLAVSLLGSALLLILTDREQAEGLGGILIRLGIVVGALWLIGPRKLDFSRKSSFSWWLIGGLLVGVLVMSRIRIPLTYFILASGLFVGLLWFAKPRKRMP